jgi:DNA mismatch repair protein MutS
VKTASANAGERAKPPAPHETPMMRQYLEVKSEHPDCLLIMRMGDFYEAFLDDAVTLAKVCGVTLTARNKDADEPVALAGFPHHSLQLHLPKLLAAGVRVAIMDQLEDPKVAAKEGRSLVKRGLTRVITAGTLLDEDALEDAQANNLVALTAVAGVVGIAALDVSTGRFTVEEATTPAQIAVALARLQPAELLTMETIARDDGELTHLRAIIEPLPPLATLPAYAWKGADARRWLCERFAVGNLDGFGIGSGEEHLAAAAAAALRYAEQSAHNPLAHVRAIRRVHAGEHLIIDATCRRNLDLVRNQRDGTRSSTVLSAIDRTRTAPGARLLAEWLSRPLAHQAGISARHDAVARLMDDDHLRSELRDALSHVYDLERLLARVATGRCHARDLVQLGGSLRSAERCRVLLSSAPVTALLSAAARDLGCDSDLIIAIEQTLVDEPPLAIGDGGLVRSGFDPELDQLRALKADAGEWLAGYQNREAQACGLPKLKVGYNRVFGYYIEISKVNGEKVPPHFIRKQTLVGAERYITPELKEYEDRALGAEERIRARELDLFTTLRNRCELALPALQRCAEALATIDVCAGLAEVARSGGWCRPVIDDSLALELRDARHPVIEAAIGRGAFVANDTVLDASKQSEGAESAASLAIITGPNMAGKSTYIRQVAIAVILAQAGSFIPAASARIGLIDRVFTRVGAGDELSRNLSTFMVEMSETAAILNHATRRSLVILDEVGRGTSTFDGVSLAWAITEHLHDAIGCRALFATHYHELTELAADRPGVRNLTVAVAEQDEQVVFLHRIVPGAATKSYGIHVAQLAGIPRTVVARAKEVLSTLEQLNVSFAERERPGAHAPHAPMQLTLFQAVESPTLQRLKCLELDSLRPKEALDLLYELQAKAKRE